MDQGGTGKREGVDWRRVRFGTRGSGQFGGKESWSILSDPLGEWTTDPVPVTLSHLSGGSGSR